MVSNSGDNSILNDDIIFKRFTRSFDSNQGNGLGLAIVSQICKYHNWKIDYEYIEKRHSFKVDFN